MAFEVFQATGTRNKAFISVTENNAFGLSRAFVDKYGITKNHKAVILYDDETNKVALHFSLNNPKFGLAVRIGNEKHGGLVAASSFFNLKSIDAPKYARRYADFEVITLKELGLNQDGKAFVLSLKEKDNTPPKEIENNAQPVEDPVINDEPINLDDIPF